MYYKMMYDSPLGPMILAASETALVGVWFEGQKYCYGALQGEVLREEETPILRKAAHWLDEYFAGRMPAIMTLPLAPQGSEFRRLVWYILCQIPYGQTTTYGDIAKQIEERTGKKMSAQAIGGAVGHNPISIIIPCHRVFFVKQFSLISPSEFPRITVGNSLFSAGLFVTGMEHCHLDA